MTNEELKSKLKSWLPDLIFNENGTYLNVEIGQTGLLDFAEKLKDDPDTDFNYLFCVSGIDFGDELGVMYHLESTRHRHIITLTVKTAERENPVLDSLWKIWPAAELQEMEVYDLFGIRFNGHPNLKRLFLGEEWVGYPLRKDYVDEVNMIIR